MQTTKPDFQSMLVQAISEPGKISAAYTTFHNYSLGNAWLAMWECAMRKIDIGPINTYKGWQALGRQVRKGEKAISLIMPVTCKVAANENEDSENSDGHTFTRFILRPHWFVLPRNGLTKRVPSHETVSYEAMQPRDLLQPCVPATHNLVCCHQSE